MKISVYPLHGIRPCGKLTDFLNKADYISRSSAHEALIPVIRVGEVEVFAIVNRAWATMVAAWRGGRVEGQHLVHRDGVMDSLCDVLQLRSPLRLEVIPDTHT